MASLSQQILALRDILQQAQVLLVVQPHLAQKQGQGEVVARSVRRRRSSQASNLSSLICSVPGSAATAGCWDQQQSFKKTMNVKKKGREEGSQQLTIIAHENKLSEYQL